MEDGHVREHEAHGDHHDGSAEKRDDDARGQADGGTASEKQADADDAADGDCPLLKGAEPVFARARRRREETR